MAPAVPQPRRAEILSLFRTLLRTAREFADYNIREYTKRRTVDTFRQNKDLSDPSAVSAAFSDGKSQLEVARRQTVVYSLWAPKIDVGELCASEKEVESYNLCEVDVSDQVERINEDVIRTHGTMITDDARIPFELMDMFDLGMDYSTDGEGGDNESEDKGGEGINAEGGEDDINEQNEEGGDNEQNEGMNNEKTTSLIKKLETLQQVNTKLEVECAGLMLAIDKMSDEMCSLQARVKEADEVIAQKDSEIAELKNRID
ncbi:hypothetical protein U1Q18_027606 [Sarracenia purpurea var. burkii]